MRVTYTECVFMALCIPYEMRLNHFVICGLSSCICCFPHYVTNGMIFVKKSLNIKCISIFSELSSQTFLILRIIKRIHHHHHHHHHHIAFRVLCLVTSSGPINSREFFWTFVVSFVSQMVDISQLSVTVCLCPFAELFAHLFL